MAADVRLLSPPSTRGGVAAGVARVKPDSEKMLVLAVETLATEVPEEETTLSLSGDVDASFGEAIAGDEGCCCCVDDVRGGAGLAADEEEGGLGLLAKENIVVCVVVVVCYLLPSSVRGFLVSKWAKRGGLVK